MWNIIIGAIFILGGASGQMAMRGTHSTGGLAILGVVLVGWGIIQLKASTPAEERPARRVGRKRPPVANHGSRPSMR